MEVRHCWRCLGYYLIPAPGRNWLGLSFNETMWLGVILAIGLIVLSLPW
jgi:hypothetical protein